MLTLETLLKTTPTVTRRRSSNPDIKIVTDKTNTRKVRGQLYRGVYCRTGLYNQDSTGTRYTCIIRNHGTQKSPTNYAFGPKSLVWVHCSCPYFTYHCEVVLAVNSSSSIYDALDYLPKSRTPSGYTTNPKHLPYVCKHLWATLTFMLAQDKTANEKAAARGLPKR